MAMSTMRTTRPESVTSSNKRNASNKAAIYAQPFPAIRNPLLPFSLVAFISAYLWPLTHELPEELVATLDASTDTIWVTQEASVRALWTRGFFGKGTLSRSEPSWWIREQNRRGYGLALTSEEVTAIRRLERKEFKQIKAKERLAAAQAGIAPPLNASLALPSKLEKQTKTTNEGLPWSHEDNAEHLQLEPIDALYLIYALRCLKLFKSGSTIPMSPSQAFRHFVHSDSPQRDNDFLIKYVAYHHFRSLGWVVRSGIKFCTDFILYKGSDGTLQGTRGAGPVGGHAEFSVVIIKRFKDAQDVLKEEQEETLLDGKGDFTWKWLSTINRATSGVKKVCPLPRSDRYVLTLQG
jgi:tRNA-splicing endonuclease subunit Sen2